MLITIKVVYEGEIRRFRHVPASFAGISCSIAHGFDLDPSRILIRYCDDDRDMCTLTPRTVGDALTFVDEEEFLLRIFVINKPPPVPTLSSFSSLSSRPNTHPHASAVYHVGVICDGCECDPLQGNRFKCRLCHNFDLCGLCFKSPDLEIRDHVARHEFIQIPAFEEFSDGDVEHVALNNDDEFPDDFPWIVTADE